MNHGIGALGRFDRFIQAQFAAGILGVGQDHDSLAACFGGELVMASQINRVVQIRAPAFDIAEPSLASPRRR